MERLSLRSMTADEFDAFRSAGIRGYAAEQVSAGKWTENEAETRATEQNHTILPQGLNTPGMLLLIAEDVEGKKIGQLWIALQAPPDFGVGAWIFYIEVEPEHRGQGFGSDLLHAAEQEVARHGIGSIGLNVFGWNAIARNLYEKAGYGVMSMHLRKELQASI